MRTHLPQTRIQTRSVSLVLPLSRSFFPSHWVRAEHRIDVTKGTFNAIHCDLTVATLDCCCRCCRLCWCLFFALWLAMNPSEKHFFLQFQYVPYRLCCSCIVSSRSLCLSLYMCRLSIHVLRLPMLLLLLLFLIYFSRVILHTVWKFCENLRVWNFSECCFVSYFACDKWRVVGVCVPFALCVVYVMHTYAMAQRAFSLYCFVWLHSSNTRFSFCL